MCRLSRLLFLTAFLFSTAQAKEATFVYTDGRTETVNIAMTSKDVFMIKKAGGGAFVSVPASQLTLETVEKYGSASMIKVRKRAERSIARSQSMREQGLVEYKGQWLPPGERDARVKRDEEEAAEARYQKEATDIAMSRYIRPQNVRIGYVHDDGHAMGKTGHWDKYAGKYYYTSKPFLILNPREQLGAGEIKFWGLYYAGSWEHKLHDPKIPSRPSIYCRSLREAVYYLRRARKLYDKTDPDVVAYYTGKALDKDLDTRPLGYGSGVIFGSEGKVLTNAHVVRGADTIHVALGDERMNAKLLRIDHDRDLALLQLPKKLPGVTFATPGNVRLGQTIFTVGYPLPELQGDSVKVTRGVVSSLNGYQNEESQMQIDAAIQGGNSGGPVASGTGQVVGLVVARLNAVSLLIAQGQLPQNVNYAIKLETIQAFLEEIPDTRFPNSPTTRGLIRFEDAVKTVSRSTVQIVVYEGEGPSLNDPAP